MKALCISCCHTFELIKNITTFQLKLLKGEFGFMHSVYHVSFYPCCSLDIKKG